MEFYCPYCGELIPEDILEDMEDIGCPSCRRTFDWEDWDKDYDADETEIASET